MSKENELRPAPQKNGQAQGANRPNLKGNEDYGIVSTAAYLIGVVEDKFKNNSIFEGSIYSRLNKDKEARIIRNLNSARNLTQRNFKKIYDAIVKDQVNLADKLDIMPYKQIRALEEDGITFNGSKNNPLAFIIRVNSLILENIEGCKRFFPAWVEWNYIKDIFVMPDGGSEDGISKETNFFFEHIERYPFKIYIHWPAVADSNPVFILKNDLIFLTTLYEWHNDAFKRVQKAPAQGGQKPQNEPKPDIVNQMPAPVKKEAIEAENRAKSNDLLSSIGTFQQKPKTPVQDGQESTKATTPVDTTGVQQIKQKTIEQAINDRKDEFREKSAEQVKKVAAGAPVESNMQTAPTLEPKKGTETKVKEAPAEINEETTQLISSPEEIEKVIKTNRRKNVKNNIWEFLSNSARAAFLIDCANSDPYDVCSAINSLDDNTLSKIKKIILFDDEESSTTWQGLSEHVKVSVECNLIKDLANNRHLLDQSLVACACNEFYKESIDSFILSSSDTNYYGLIKNLPEANFIIMMDRDEVSTGLEETLTSQTTDYCYIDEFYLGKKTMDNLKKELMAIDVDKQLKEIVVVNINDLYSKAVLATRAKMDPKEEAEFRKEFLTKWKVDIQEDGNIRLIIK